MRDLYIRCLAEKYGIRNNICARHQNQEIRRGLLFQQELTNRGMTNWDSKLGRQIDVSRFSGVTKRLERISGDRSSS